MENISWQLVSNLYDTSKELFIKEGEVRNADAFLACLKTATSANECALIVNTNNETIYGYKTDSEPFQLDHTALIDYLPLLFQSCTCTRLDKQDISNLSEQLRISAPEDMIDCLYFALEKNETESIFFVQFRNRNSGEFSEAEFGNVENVEAFLTEFINMSLSAVHGGRMMALLKEHKKSQSIWLESLAWINQAGDQELNDDELQEFYSTSLFQLKMLVLADFASSFSVDMKSGAILKIASHGENDNSVLMCELITNEIGLKNFNKQAVVKLNKNECENLIAANVCDAIFFPLYVQRDLRMILCVGRNKKKFGHHEEQVATLFAEGLEHIIERNDLLKSIQNRNLLLQQERNEQQLLIEKLKEAKDQLLQQEKMASIGQLAAGVAHEINNPVGYVNSNINTMGNYINDLYEILEQYEKLESVIPEDNEMLTSLHERKQELDFDFIREDVQDLIAESKEGVVRVRDIVKDLKDFSHVDEAEWQWADLARGIQSTLNIVHNELKYKATIETDFQPLPEVECVPSQINQIVMNLLVNAGHAIEEKGTIKISTRHEDDKVMIAIADTGKGIEEKHLSKLFDPFFTTKPVGKGTGLGLSLSYSIAERHSGELQVESELGVGTTFTLVLPVKQTEAKAEKAVE